MKPICVRCKRFYRCKKNGYWFIEMMPKENGALPGTQDEDAWTPYKLWVGDLWQCVGCGHETVAGVSSNPAKEHYEPTFKLWVESMGADQLHVNDC